MKHLHLLRHGKPLSLAAVIALLALNQTAAAAPVDTALAEQVARNFWNSQHDKDVPALTTTMNALVTRWDAFYIFTSAEATGFVIVAADDCVQPILGYSFRNPVQRDGFHRELAWWLDGYQQQIDACRETGALPSAEVSAGWQRWNSESSSATAAPKGVTPLLTTQWDQGYPYNNLCPTTTNHSDRAVTGCVATAMAQVMRYWSHPQRGTGSHTYTPIYWAGSSQFGTQSADFGSTVYHWDLMPNRLASTASGEEKNAVATLMYHCGVAVDMQYGTSHQGGSGAYVHNVPLLDNSHTLNGMVNFFGYSSNATALIRKHYEDSEWIEILRTELRAGRPIIYTGNDGTSGGHCFVCDGFGGLGYFHFNWGWGGIGDGDFTVNNLAPGTGGIGGGSYNFTQNQDIIVGLEPHGENDSLCFIRQFPYSQDFETAPTCWSAEGTHAGQSWQVKDINGVDGNYSAGVSAPYYEGSDDHLYSPYICEPGHYRLGWQARSLGLGNADHYTVSAGSLLLADTLRSTDWLQRNTTFDIAAGDTVRLDFHYIFSGGSTGVLVDRITIEKLWDAGIDEVLSVHRCRLYPNPTQGSVRIDGDAPILQVELLDINGRSLQRGTAQTLELGGRPKGIYLLRVTTPSGVETHRVVKK